jgi:hypothetical protein
MELPGVVFGEKHGQFGIFRPAGTNECSAEFYPALGLFVVRELAMYPAVFALNKL